MTPCAILLTLPKKPVKKHECSLNGDHHSIKIDEQVGIEIGGKRSC